MQVSVNIAHESVKIRVQLQQASRITDVAVSFLRWKMQLPRCETQLLLSSSGECRPLSYRCIDEIVDELRSELKPLPKWMYFLAEQEGDGRVILTALSTRRFSFSSVISI